MGQEAVHDAVYAKVVLLADNPTGLPTSANAGVVSGALMISGGKLHVFCANAWQLVTSASV